MFVEELSKIKECEDKAEKIRKDARTRFGKDIEEARTEAEGLIEQAETKAAEIRENAIKLGEKESGRNYDASIEQARKEAARLTEKAKPNMQKAVAFIVERIVKVCGNN